RRHTRWPRDWSSDVCSSDLQDEAGQLHAAANHPVLDLQTGGGDPVVDARDLPIEPGQLALAEHVHEAGPALAVEGVGPCGVALRSEERRVGKEWRSRWCGVA